MEVHDIIQSLISCGALRTGEFQLQDGSIVDEWYFPVKAFQYPPLCRKLAFEIVNHFLDMDVQVVIAARIGAIPFATEIARQLEARLLWSDHGGSVFYPELAIHSGDRAIIIDDILMDDIQPYKQVGREILQQDARLIGIGALIDLSMRKTPLNVRQISVLKREMTFIESLQPLILPQRT